MVRGDHERLGGLCEDNGAWQAAGDLDEHQGHLRNAVSREGRMIIVATKQYRGGYPPST